MSKKIAVLFSGGLDSTYLIWKNLKDDNEVYPVYIEIENNQTKTILEKNRIKLLIKEFRKEFTNEKDYSGTRIHDIEYALKVTVSTSEFSLYFKQIPVWIFGTAFLQSLPVSEIQIGYVTNDDAVSFLEDIKKIYKSYQAICEPMKRLTFPVSKVRKIEMAEQLPKQYLDLIFSCENATIIGSEDAEIIDYEPCCSCPSCKRVISSNYYGLGRFPEKYKKGIRMQHAVALLSEGFRVLDKNGNDFQNIKKFEYKKEPYQLDLYLDGVNADKVEEDSSNLEKVPFNG
jgi:hypothetical protein